MENILDMVAEHTGVDKPSLLKPENKKARQGRCMLVLLLLQHMQHSWDDIAKALNITHSGISRAYWRGMDAQVLDNEFKKQYQKLVEKWKSTK